ncbi:MAG: alcohol dehydrogenase catalytic domain-containing protein [Candidatus Brocadiia bacterium]
MRQAVMTEPGRIEFRQAPEPEPGPGELLLRVQRIGICGSDVHVWHGRHPFTSYPVVQGHEFSAVVEAAGEEVEDYRPGQKVTARPQVVCGECPPCKRGDYHICDNLRVEGFQAPGCAQDLFVTNADRAVALPEEFTHEQGALVEPTSVAVHAVSRAGELEGRSVAVLGAGAIGNLVAQVCKARGAQVLITDVAPFRLQVAEQCGIGATSNVKQEELAEASERVFGPGGFDVAFECAGVEAAVRSAIQGINKGGTIVIVAVHGEEPTLPLALVQDRELEMVGTLMYRHEDYEEAVRLIAGGQIATAPLDSKHFPFEQYAEAYEFIEQQGVRSMKVFIDM